MQLSIAELLKDLPEEPVLALTEMRNRVYGYAQANEPNGLSSAEYRTAVITIDKYARGHEVALPGVFDSQYNGHDWGLAFQFRSKAIDELMEPYEIEKAEQEAELEVQRLQAIQNAAPGFAILSPEEKSAISEKIEVIRRLVDESALSPRKKNAISKRIASLYSEVMKDGTAMDTLYIVMGELGFNAGVMAKNARPALKEVKEIAKILASNRARKEGIPLPKPEDFLQLTNLSGE